jgi:hypothetical protein
MIKISEVQAELQRQDISELQRKLCQNYLDSRTVFYKKTNHWYSVVDNEGKEIVYIDVFVNYSTSYRPKFLTNNSYKNDFWKLQDALDCIAKRMEEENYFLIPYDDERSKLSDSEKRLLAMKIKDSEIITYPRSKW